MIEKINKVKGEITTQQIVLLIILLISFVVILFFIVGFDFFATSDSEICHNSVVSRSISSSDAVVPLKCSRSYICLSKDKSCERMTDPKIEKVASKEEVYFVLAEKMADCWWMFGEGRIDYIGKDFFKKNNYCSICSQIGFDDSIKEIEGIEQEINKDEFYDYLAKTKMPESELTYSEYFFGTKDVARLKRVTLETEDGTEVVAGTFGKIDLNKQYFIIMGITSEVSGRVWKMGAGVLVFAGGLVTGYSWAGLILGGLLYGATEVTGGIEPEISAIIVEGDGIKNNFMAPTIQEANSNTLIKFDCKDVITSI